MVAGLRRLARGPADGNGGRRRRAGAASEACDLCGKPLDPDHRHLLHLVDRRILCTCESCLALRGGDPELRPTGTRTVWLDDFELSDEPGRRSGSRSGSRSSSTRAPRGGIVALYPSPAGATESELEIGTWRELRSANPVLMSLEPDAEALIVNRIADPPEHAIAPIDECYRLVGHDQDAAGTGSRAAPGSSARSTAFFDELREKASG